MLKVSEERFDYMINDEKRMQIATVVVTYNRKELLLECIDAILSQTYSPEKIIIIDNASTDGTRQALDERGYISDTRIDYRCMETNLGGAGGFYEGIRIAWEIDPEWIWIMDDDTIPERNCLKNLVNNTQNSANVSFLASCVRSIGGEPMNVPTLDDTPAANGYPDWYMNLEKNLVKINSATFVSIMINKMAVDICGLPCSHFFLWGDDTEYTRRLVKHFGPAYLVGGSWVCHKRKDAKSLNVRNINDRNRIKNIHYLSRNGLIITAKYDGALKMSKLLINYGWISIRSIFEGRNGFRKFIALQKGIFEFLFQYRKFSRIIDAELER